MRLNNVLIRYWWRMPGGRIRAVIKNHCYSTKYWLLGSSHCGHRHCYYDLLRTNLFSLHYSVCKRIRVFFARDDDNISVWTEIHIRSIVVEEYKKFYFIQKLFFFPRLYIKMSPFSSHCCAKQMSWFARTCQSTWCVFTSHVKREGSSFVAGGNDDGLILQE